MTSALFTHHLARNVLGLRKTMQVHTSALRGRGGRRRHLQAAHSERGEGEHVGLLSVLRRRLRQAVRGDRLRGLSGRGVVARSHHQCRCDIIRVLDCIATVAVWHHLVYCLPRTSKLYTVVHTLTAITQVIDTRYELYTGLAAAEKGCLLLIIKNN